MKLATLIIVGIASLFFIPLSSCSFKSVKRSKNIRYLDADPVSKTKKQTLNIFGPRKWSTSKEVLIFIHGGGWNSGKKSLYNFFGTRMARKNVVVVIINYPLSPAATYNGMARAVAKSVRWVHQNIEKYGGDPEKIFISGHSAGGHLAALISVRHEYVDSIGLTSPIKGTILIDAAGLDMYGYLQEQKFSGQHSYLKTFTKNPIYWKEASPLYHLHTDIPPMLIYMGENTLPSIINSHAKFIDALRSYSSNTAYYILKGKKHVPMITQFFKQRNPHYREIIDFMKKN
jgi:acetyl esterase/lipase